MNEYYQTTNQNAKIKFTLKPIYLKMLNKRNYLKNHQKKY